MSTWILGARMAGRELRRRPWRSLLVILLVLIPTASMTIVAIWLRTSEWTADDRREAQFGRADLIAYPRTTSAGDTDTDGLLSQLPAGTEVLVQTAMSDRIREGDRRVYFTVSDVPIDHPVAAGRFGAFSGRLPAGPDEAVVSAHLARRGDLDIGDMVTTDVVGGPLRVVGRVDLRGDTEDVLYVQAPLPEGFQRWTTLYVDLPGAMEFAGREVAGWDLEPVIGGPDERHSEGIAWSYVGGGVGLLVLGTVITAAFAVGARRQLRTIGLLSASGASPSIIKAFLVIQGAVAGAVGSVLGVTAGIAVSYAVPRRWIEGAAGHHIDSIVIRPLDLVPILLLGTAVAAGAAWLPARSASTAPTLQALAGRRPQPAVPGRLPLFGLTSIGLGCAAFAMAVSGAAGGGSSLWALVAVIGGMLVLFGAVAIAPWVIDAVERMSGGWPESWRLAGRSLGRSRVRSSAVVGAVCTVVATVVAGTTLFASYQGDNLNHSGVRPNHVFVRSYTLAGLDSSKAVIADRERAAARVTGPEVGPVGAPVPPEVLDRLGDVAPGGRLVQFTDLVNRDGHALGEFVQMIAGEKSGAVHIVIASPEVMDLFAVPEPLRSALDDGKAVAIQRRGEAPSRIFLGERVGAEPRLVDVAGAFESDAASDTNPNVLISPATASDLGFTLAPSASSVVVFDRNLSKRERDAVRLLADDLNWEQNTRPPEEGRAQIWLDVQSDEVISPAVVKAGLLGVSLLLVMAVVAVGLALAARDSEDERQILAAVGAPPRSLRRVAALRASLLVLTATVIGVPAGLLPAAAVVAADPGSPSFLPDWWALAFVVAAVPVAVGAVVAVGSRVREAVRPTLPVSFLFGD